MKEKRNDEYMADSFWHWSWSRKFPGTTISVVEMWEGDHGPAVYPSSAHSVSEYKWGRNLIRSFEERKGFHCSVCQDPWGGGGICNVCQRLFEGEEEDALPCE